MKIVIANTAIRADAEGRFCLNDLHRAAVSDGANERTKEPGKFLASPQIIDLMKELTDTQNPGIAPVTAIKGGLQQGTYVCKELVYAYAMWISAAFHLKVIRAYDAMATQSSAPAVPQTLPEALRLAADLAEQKVALEEKVAEQTPKVEALDRIAAGRDSLTLTQAAKVLGVKVADLTKRMHAAGWIYRQNGSWVGYDYRIKSGALSYKEANYTDEKTGMACIKPYCHVTPKGLVKLAEMFGMNPPINGLGACARAQNGSAPAMAVAEAQMQNR